MPIRFSLAQVETTKQNLDALPAADKSTRQVGLKDAIRALAPTLRKLHAKGYSREKIVELLREQGIPVGKSSLHQFLGQKSSKGPGSRPATVQGKDAVAPATPAGSEPVPAAPSPTETAEVGTRKPSVITVTPRQPVAAKPSAPSRS